MKNTHSPDITPEQPALLSWEGEVEVHHIRTKTWYIVALTIVALFIGYSIITQAWSFALLILLMTGLYWFVHNKKIPPKQVHILPHGIYLGSKYYSWTECESFWLLHSDEYHELHIKTRRSSSDDIRIQTGDVDPLKIRELLSSFLPELSEQGEKILDKLQRILKI